MEEVVFTIDYILRSSLALYWGTSMWSARELEAHKVCKELGCMPPIVEQPSYSMLMREKVGKEYDPICKKYGMVLPLSIRWLVVY